MLEESGVVDRDENAGPRLERKTRIRDSGDHRFARLGDRFIAFILDLGVAFGLFAVVDAWSFMRWGRVVGTELQLTTACLLFAVISNALILFLYGWLMEALCGATVGKIIIGLRVVGTSTRGPFSACALRNAFRIVDGIGFYLVGTVTAACSGVRQRLGDIYSKTAVIEESFGPAIRVTVFVLWAGIIGGSAWAVPRICSSNQALETPFLGRVIVRVGKSGNSAYFKAESLSVDVQLASADE